MPPYDEPVKTNEPQGAKEETMDHFEMTEKLRERAQVSYEEAKEALELNEWDMLEAMVYLEREGKANRPFGPEKPEQPQPDAGKEKKQRVSGNLFETAANTLAKLVEKGNRNRLEIYRDGRQLSKLPLTVVAVLSLVMFWIVIPALVIGWMFGCSYRLSGPDIDKGQTAGEAE